MAAAEDEGKLLVYASTGVFGSDGKLLDGFREQYPSIEVEVFAAATGDLLARLEQEAEAGVQADVAIHTEIGWFDEMKKAGSVVDPIGPSSETWPTEYVLGDACHVVSLNPFVIGVNTEAVTTEIENYVDVLDERYRGRLGTSEIDIARSVAVWYDFLEREHDPEFMTKLAALDPVIGRGPQSEALGSGEIAIDVTSVTNSLVGLMEAGAPVDFVLPDPALALTQCMGILTDAPSPNAAQVFFNYLISEEGQTVWHGSGLSASPRNVPGSMDLSKLQIWDWAGFSDEDKANVEQRWYDAFR